MMIYPAEHQPPHFHAWGRGISMWVVIADGAIMREKGKVTPRDRRLIKAWTAANREALMENWTLIRDGKDHKMIL
jgi:hypothetical protein